LKHIELFAGCGGMSVGLEAAGFELFMANELSPMAGETLAYNVYGENLLKLAQDKKGSEKILWINSNYPNDNLTERLRENPFDFSKGKFSDIDSNTDFSNKLVVGNIDHFLKYLAHNLGVSRILRKKNIDLLSGGPPCQGFSLAGKRVKDDYKNLLPLSFARFAGLIQPKIVLLENVKGITSPFKTEDGQKHHAFLEVAKAFSIRGFYPICMLLNSKYFGVPQNRPRFILFALRKDVFLKFDSLESNSDPVKKILSNSKGFYEKVHKYRNKLDEVKKSDIHVYDIESEATLFDGIILPKIQTNGDNFVQASEAIGDILSAKKTYLLKKIKNEYAIKLTKLFKQKFKNEHDDLQNHVQRNHTHKVKARFRLYQVLNKFNGIRLEASQVIIGKSIEENVFIKIYNSFKNESLLVKRGESEVFEKPQSSESFREYLNELKSKKHSQRAIKSDEPAPAQLTIPDDLCHYSEDELRTLTVREMARFQSFPDWFIFRSKITTGGEQRCSEVPQYTQVGNAVPPLLAYELGKTITNILKSIE